MKTETNFAVEKFPVNLRQRYKAACIKKGVTMRNQLIALIEIWVNHQESKSIDAAIKNRQEMRG
jgi:hypothetical protein